MYSASPRSPIGRAEGARQHGSLLRMPRWIAQAVVYPLQLFHALWWRAGSLLTGVDLERDRLNHFAGSFSFIASKDA